MFESPADWEHETTDTETCLSTAGRFNIASEVWYRELVLKTSEVNQTGDQEISGTARFRTDTGQVWEQQTTVQLQIATVPEIAEHLSIVSIEMPTDATGTVDSRQREDTIHHARPLFSWLGTPQTNAFEPMTYQTIRLRNTGEETIHVVVSSVNTDMKSGATVPFLAPPETANGGDKSEHSVREPTSRRGYRNSTTYLFSPRVYKTRRARTGDPWGIYA